MGLLEKSTFPVTLTPSAELDLSKLHSTAHPSYTEHPNDPQQAEHNGRRATGCDSPVQDTGYQGE
jgi:hypothetical protein